MDDKENEMSKFELDEKVVIKDADSYYINLAQVPELKNWLDRTCPKEGDIGTIVGIVLYKNYNILRYCVEINGQDFVVAEDCIAPEH